MKKFFVRSRKARFARLSVILTVLVVAVTVLANTVFSTLANRYGWYSQMVVSGDYVVNEACYTLLDEAFAEQSKAGNAPQVRVMFCSAEEAVRKDSMLNYLYSTVTAFAQRYSNYLKVECHDILTNPTVVKPYLTSTNPITGEEMKTELKTSSLIITCGDYYRVYALTEFFSYKDGDTATVWAYNGEKKLVSGIMHAVDTDKPMVCLTENHGEVYYDYELMYLLDDAGYIISYIDLQTEPIPESCELIISYNPNSDLVDDQVSAVSELTVLEEFLSKSGHSFLVFMESGSPELPNYESFLASWGVSFGYYKDVTENRSYRYTVQDSAKTLTSDNCTIYGTPIATGASAKMLEGLNSNMIFKNATALKAAQGFVNNGDGSYTKGNRIMYSLYESSETSNSWANGAARDGSAMLMSVTRQTNGDGASHVGVVSSARFCTQEFLQSAVYGNSDGLFRLLEATGKEGTPQGLKIKPFFSLDISTVTTAQILRWTLVLTLVPTVLITAVAVVVFARRRRG